MYATPWRPNEIRFLRESYRDATDEAIGLILVRTTMAVAQKRLRLGLKKPHGRPLSPRRVKQLSDTEAAYLAGILDGEGSVFLRRIPPFLQAKMQISNTDMGLMDWLMDVTGIGGVSDVGVSHLGKKNLFLWVFTAKRDVIALAQQLRPFLIIKKETVDEVVKELILSDSRLETFKYP